MATQKIPTLVGIGGYSKGEKYPLKYGKTLVVGRSRSADFSLRRLESYLSLPAEERDADEKFLTVSGRHFEITMYNVGSIELKNLSPNGTCVDGKPIDTLVVDDVAERKYEITIGLEEKFSLEMAEHEVDAEGEPPPASDSSVQDLGQPDEISSPAVALTAERSDSSEEAASAEAADETNDTASGEAVDDKDDDASDSPE